MILTKLDIRNFRNIHTITFEPHISLNLISGSNGSGKTSILECIQCLSTGHSFRTRKTRELIQRNSDTFGVTALFHDPEYSRDHRAGLQRSRDGKTDMRLDFEEISSIAEVTRLLPIKSLTPESHKLIQDGPEERRQFLDWGVFHVEPIFYNVWKQFKRSLSQRNSLIRDGGSSKELRSWDLLFLDSSATIDRCRRQYVLELSKALKMRLNTLNFMFHVELQYRSGWSADYELSELLVRNAEYHRRMKTTTDGPHRAEMVILSDGVQAKQLLSRGQQKVLVYLLHLSQLDLLQSIQRRQAIMLCDDLTSELDNCHSQKIIQQLVDLRSQVFVTGVDLTVLETQNHERIHMVNGNIEKVV